MLPGKHPRNVPISIVLAVSCQCHVPFWHWLRATSTGWGDGAGYGRDCKAVPSCTDTALASHLHLPISLLSLGSGLGALPAGG
eukprot:1664959-Prymnesium_polylepis.1